MRVCFLAGHVFPPKASGGGNLFNRKMYEALLSICVAPATDVMREDMRQSI